MTGLACPNCGQQAGARIIWGMSTPDLFAQVESGELDVVLGGCDVPDPLVNATCRSCGARWLHDDDPADAVSGSVDASIGGYFGPSYRVQAEGGTVRWTARLDGHDTGQAAVRPDAEAWQRFWAAVDDAGAWAWDADYDEPGVLDGTSWSLRLEHEGRAVDSSGSNAWPPGWEQVQAALEQLAGGPWR